MNNMALPTRPLQPMGCRGRVGEKHIIITGMPSETEVIMKKKLIKEMEPEQRPYEKVLTFGTEALTDAELLAIILRTGSKEESSIDLADRILNPGPDGSKTILNIFDYEIEDLMKIKGIGKVKAIQIKAVVELSKRIAKTKAGEKLDFRDPETIALYYMEQLRHNTKEQIVLIMLDSACHMIKDKIISIGTVNTALYSPREILFEALRNNAVNIILMHNHPSGDPKPSTSDMEATVRIRDAGNLVGIPLLDHIIVGDRNYYSFKREGKLG